MSGINKVNRKKQLDRSDAASIVAGIYHVTPRYVRLIIADAKKEKYKGANPEKIREMYHLYLEGKTNLIKTIEKIIKVA